MSRTMRTLGPHVPDDVVDLILAHGSQTRGSGAPLHVLDMPIRLAHLSPCARPLGSSTAFGWAEPLACRRVRVRHSVKERAARGEQPREVGQ